MKELLLEVLGWLGYLERPVVLVQLLICGLLMLSSRVGKRRRWLGRHSALACPALGLTLLMVAGILLRSHGQPAGLVALLGVLWLGWTGLQLLHQPLSRRLPPARLHQLESRLLRPGFLLMATLLVISEFDSLSDVAVIELAQVQGVTVSVGKLFNGLLVLYLVLVACGPPAAGLAWLLQRAVGMSNGSRKASELMLRYLVVGAGLVGVALHLGLNSTALIAVAGGLSVGLGFGIKEVFSNIVSGLWLLIEGSVRPGEVLMHEGEACEVRRLGPRATTLWRGGDNAEVVVPNQSFFTTATTTYTRSDRMRRCSLSLGVASRWSPAQIVTLLESIAADHSAVLREPAPKARLMEFGSERYGYKLSFSIADPLTAGSVTADLRLAICRRFADLGMDPPA